MNLVVYSKNNCPGCNALKSKLRAKSIPFTELNIDTSPDAKTFLLEQNHRSVPVIYKDGVHVLPASIGL